MSASTIPAAKQAILDLLTADADMSSVVVSRGGPVAEENFADEMAYFEGVEQEEEWRGLGSPRTEDFTLTMAIVVRVVGRTGEADADDRAWQIRSVVADAIHADPSLGELLKEKGAEVATTRQEGNQPLTDGWGTRLTLEINCRTVLV
jgi:hypothetical protein